jgi:hypothetical protein
MAAYGYAVRSAIMAGRYAVLRAITADMLWCVLLHQMCCAGMQAQSPAALLWWSVAG